MNKLKIITPLLVAAPVLFACGNKSIAGNYKVQEADKIAHKFTIGNEKSYATSGFITLPEIKTAIYDKLTKCYDGSYTDNKTVRLSNEMGVPAQTVDGENVTIYPVNLRETGESTMDMAFEYGKTSTGYHFFGNYMAGYDNLEIVHHVKRESGVRTEELVVDNGFKVEGNTLTANFIGRFVEEDDGERMIDYQIEFTVTATK